MCWSSWVPLPLGGRLWTGYKGSRRLRRGPRRKNKPVKRLRSDRCGTTLSPKCNKFTPSAATPQQPKYNWAFLKRWSRGAFRYTVASSSVHAPQQLDGAQVRAGLEQMRGEAVPAMPNPEICRIFSPSLAAVPICALLIRHSPEESRDPSRHLKKNLSTKPIPFTGKRGHSWEEDQG